MNLSGLLKITLLISFITLFISTTVWSQSKNYQEDPSNLELTKLSGFIDDDRIKVLLLNLLPSGMTETAAVEIARVLQQNIFNTNHFSVVGPAEWNSQIKDRDPTLADCHDVACGVMIGKLFDADKILVGTIYSETMLNENGEEQPSFILSVKMVDVRTNNTTFSDEVQFTDLQMHDELFRLAARTSDNTLLLGNIDEVEPTGITLNLGRAQGIKTGQQFVILRKTTNKSTLNNNFPNKTYQKTALAEVFQVNDFSSKAVIIQRISTVSKGDQVQTYINIEKLISLMTQARKELDTQKRLRPKKRILRLGPPAAKDNSGYSNWSVRYKTTKAQHDRWMYTSAGVGAATLFFISGSIKLSGFLSVLPWIAGAGTVYSGIRYFHYRDLLNELSTEGRTNGFYSNSLLPRSEGWNFIPVPTGIQVAWSRRF